MRFNFTRHLFPFGFAALTLLMLCVVQPQVRAQDGPNETITFVYGTLGIVPGQTLRYSWAFLTRVPRSASLNDAEPQFEPLVTKARLLGTDGRVISEAQATAVGRGQFQSLDFNRNRINVPGEPLTGRLQARLEVLVTVRRGTWITDGSFERRFSQTFVDVLEIIDDASGRTTVGLGGGNNALSLDDSPGNEALMPNGFLEISAGTDRLFGIARGQTARFTTNPGSTDQTRQVSLVKVMLLDASGAPIAQSDEIAIPPGECRSIDFNRDALPLVGETGTGRVQLRAQVRYRFFSIIDRSQLNATTSLELFDNTTGRTSVVFPGFSGGVNVASSDVN